MGNLTDSEQQKKALGIIWTAFKLNKSKIALALNVSPPVVSQWFKRGRVSASAAIKLEKTKELKGVITKEEMRPDVKEWFGV